MLVTTEVEFVKEYKKDIIKFLEKARETIVSKKEDERVKQIIENIQQLNSNDECFVDIDAYNTYLMEKFGS